jgi:dihydrofolate reductase
MKTQYYTASSLDGFIATEDHSIDWLFPLADINQSSYPEFIEQIGAIAMGSGTYEWLLNNADAVIAEVGSPWPYTQPVWVFSHRTLPIIADADIHYVQGDVREHHTQMCAAAAGKNIWIAGGGELAAQFYDVGLLDEMIIQIGSVTLGSGRPVFPRQTLSPALKLKSVQQMGEGMAELRYSVHSEE